MHEATFLLLHSGSTASWTWERVRPHLAGPSIAPDLPAHGAAPGDLARLDWAQCLSATLAALPPDGALVVVGHSLTVPLALLVADATRPRLRHLLAIAGMVPEPGRSIVDHFPASRRWLAKLLLPLTRGVLDPEAVRARSLFSDLPEAEARSLARRMTPESSRLLRDPVRWSGAVAPATYVRCTADRSILDPGAQLAMAARLGGAREDLDTGHHPMLSQPAALAALLNRFA